MLRRQLGKEPTDGQASALIRQLDRDKSGTVFRLQWPECNGDAASAVADFVRRIRHSTL